MLKEYTAYLGGQFNAAAMLSAAEERHLHIGRSASPKYERMHN